MMTLLSHILVLWFSNLATLLVGLVVSIFGAAKKSKTTMLIGVLLLLPIPFWMALNGYYLYLLIPVVVLVATYSLPFKEGKVTAGLIALSMVPAVYLSIFLANSEMVEEQRFDNRMDEFEDRVEAIRSVNKS